MGATDYGAVHLPALTARYGFPIAVTLESVAVYGAGLIQSH